MGLDFLQETFFSEAVCLNWRSNARLNLHPGVDASPGSTLKEKHSPPLFEDGSRRPEIIVPSLRITTSLPCWFLFQTFIILNGTKFPCSRFRINFISNKFSGMTEKRFFAPLRMTTFYTMHLALSTKIFQYPAYKRARYIPKVHLLFCRVP